MLIMLYASAIVGEKFNKTTGENWVFADVPNKLKAQVADVLVSDCGLPELVPAEFGGIAN